VVEVAPIPNTALDLEVLARGGTVAYYAVTDTDPHEKLTLPALDLLVDNFAWHGVLVYTVSAEQKDNAVADVSAAVADGALRVGEEAGLPLHRYPLERTADAHAAVQGGAVGKVLIDLV